MVFKEMPLKKLFIQALIVITLLWPLQVFAQVKLNCSPVWSANVGISDFDIRKVHGKKKVLLLDVQNFGTLLFHGWIRIKDAKHILWEQEIHLFPGQTRRFLPALFTNSDTLTAVLTGGPDYLSIDNTAMLSLPRHLITVGWFGNRDPGLLTLLALLPYVRLEFPQAKDLEPGMFDLVVWNSEPMPPPGLPALILCPGLPKKDAHTLPAPFTGGLFPFSPIWTGDLRITSLCKCGSSADEALLTDTRGRPLILLSKNRLILCFDLSHSNLEELSDFAEFIDGVLKWAVLIGEKEEQWTVW